MDRLRQMGEAYRQVRRRDPRLDAYVALAIGIPVVAGLAVSAVTGQWVLWMPSAVLLGVLFGLLVFGRRLQAAQFEAMEGVPGAAAAVLDRMRGQWFVVPGVGVNKQQEMVHRVVGRCGVVLVTEGGTGQRVKSLVARERKKVQRVAGDAPVHVVMVGDGEDGTVELTKLQVAVAKFPNELSKTEVPRLARRLAPLDRGNIPMPKGHIPRGRPR